MALAAPDSNIEARIARLESDVGHIRSDLGDVKQDVRDLRARVDGAAERFEGRFDGIRQHLENRFDELRDRIDAVERSVASAKVWALMLFIAQAAAVYGTLARTMGWI
jgi:uncharacterized protein YukE